MTPSEHAARNPFEPEPWVDAKPIAAYLTCSRSAVLLMALKGAIPCLTLPSRGGDRCRYRFRMSDVIAWAERRAKSGRRK